MASLKQAKKIIKNHIDLVLRSRLLLDSGPIPVSDRRIQTKDLRAYHHIFNTFPCVQTEIIRDQLHVQYNVQDDRLLKLLRSLIDDQSGITWTNNTQNFWIGCTKVSRACGQDLKSENDGCYACVINHIFKHNPNGWGNHADRTRTSPANWKKPYKWNRIAAELQIMLKVFTLSMGDFFDAHQSIDAAWRAEAWKIIKETPNLLWLILTKRPQNIARFLPSDWGEGYANVMLGVTAEDQQHWDRRVSILATIPAVGYFISVEPMFSDITDYSLLERINHKPVQVIYGGESGDIKKLWPTDPKWIIEGIGQCRAYGVSPYVKQMGKLLAEEWKLDDSSHGSYPYEWPEPLRVQEFPNWNWQKTQGRIVIRSSESERLIQTPFEESMSL